MFFIPIAIECVCEKLEMPAVPKTVCQMAIIAIAIFAAIQIATASPTPQSRMPSLSPMPSIIAPEKR